MDYATRNCVFMSTNPHKRLHVFTGYKNRVRQHDESQKYISRQVFLMHALQLASDLF